MSPVLYLTDSALHCHQSRDIEFLMNSWGTALYKFDIFFSINGNVSHKTMQYAEMHSNSYSTTLMNVYS